ncbi:Mitotic checkpoint protein BUB3.1 [Cryptosporidium felis]|nr:Mitotic checkpoint protein BUB3.1 [Cryptosporidium felis]
MQNYFLAECPDNPISSFDVTLSHYGDNTSNQNESSLLALSSWDKSVRIYDLQMPSNMTLDFTSKETYEDSNLESKDGGVDSSINLQNTTYLPTGKCISSCEGNNIYLTCKFRDNSNLFVGGFNEGVDIINLRDSSLTPMRIVSHSAPVRCLSLLEKSSILASGSWDGDVILTSVGEGSSGSQISKIEVKGKVFCMDYTFDGEWLLVGDSFKNMNLINLKKLSSGVEPSSPTEVVPNFMKYQLRNICANRHKDVFATSSVEGRVQITSVEKVLKGEVNSKENPKDNYAFKCHRIKDNSTMTETVYPVNSVCFHHKFVDVLATGGSDGSVFIWDTNAKKRLWRNSGFHFVDSDKNLIRICKEGVSSLKFHPTLPYLISSCCDIFDQPQNQTSEVIDQAGTISGPPQNQKSSIVFHYVQGVKPLEL